MTPLQSFKGRKLSTIQGFKNYTIVVAECPRPFDPPTYFWFVCQYKDSDQGEMESVADNTHDYGEGSSLLAIAAAQRTIDYSL